MHLYRHERIANGGQVGYMDEWAVEARAVIMHAHEIIIDVKGLSKREVALRDIGSAAAGCPRHLGYRRRGIPRLMVSGLRAYKPRRRPRKQERSGRAALPTQFLDDQYGLLEVGKANAAIQSLFDHLVGVRREVALNPGRACSSERP